MAEAGLGLLDRLLSYCDKPWKVVAIIALAIVGGAGWLIWDKRDVLFDVWLTPTARVLKTAEVPAALAKLTTETSADLVQIWAVDLGSNSQWFLGARRHDGERPVIPAPRRLPVMVTASDVGALIDVMEGHPICLDLSKTGSPLARRLEERGMKRGCAIPIPPTNESFLGVIYLAWSEDNMPDASAENVAAGVAREIAASLATR
jgi:hypothetical protein